MSDTKTVFHEILHSLQQQLQHLSQVSDLLHQKLVFWITKDTDPRSKVALAEMIKSYVQLHEATLSVKKEIVDIPMKEIMLKHKEEQLDLLHESSKLDVFTLQRILQVLESSQKSSLERIEEISSDDTLSYQSINEQS